MRYLLLAFLLTFIWVIAYSLGPVDVRSESADSRLTYIQEESVLFSQNVDSLYSIINRLDNSRASVNKAKSALKSCRIQYKSISFFLSYFYPQTAQQFNGPAKYEVEEPYREFEEPVGLQQTETILYRPHPEKYKRSILDLVQVMKESSADLNSLYYSFFSSPDSWMESVHLELIRIMTLYITGYDAPLLKSGIAESKKSLESLEKVVQSTLPASLSTSGLVKAFYRTIGFLSKDCSFDSFNRLVFLTRYALPLEQKLSAVIKENGWQVSSRGNLNYQAVDLFKNEIRTGEVSPLPEMIRLGKELFSDQRLSGNSKRSCASCHQPDKYFSDGLTHNKKLDGSGGLRRNTPSLLYSAFQSAQFWDGRAANAETQVRDVILNPDEMNGSLGIIIKRMRADAVYSKFFRDTASSAVKDSQAINILVKALAAYIRQLTPFRSDFDRFISGNKKAMNPDQQSGFNLFMGKAKCGTCHFAPVFNGSVPPFFDKSEFEVLGVTSGDDFSKPLLDRDPGRYGYFAAAPYLYAFKTPTVRNIARTGPYMHNGKFRTLQKLLVFYNKGGGAGLGLTVPTQTLDPGPLHLSRREMKLVICFLRALTDHLSKPVISQPVLK